MKIKITYETESHLQAVLDALKPIIKGSKVRKSDTYKPYKHAYITVKSSENPCK